jgi:3-oxoacyl-[acyl-carrier-protein] synthase II
MKRRRVKITGIGFVTPAGIGKEAFWKGIHEPVSRVVSIERFRKEAGPFIAAEVKGFKLEDFHRGVTTKRMARHTQFALAAAKLAVLDAGLDFGDLRGRMPAITVGATLMDFGVINSGVDMILRRGPVTGIPGSVSSASVSSISGSIGREIGGVTQTMAMQSDCCAGLDSIAHAAEMIATGRTDLALGGGTESPLYFHPMLELKMAGLASGNESYPERQCRPFDLWRTTGAIGEGACILLLEPESSPRSGYAYIDGHATSNDPSGILCAGMPHAIRCALANAGISSDQVECINAWGPGHREIDAAESAALTSVFGEGISTVPAVSIKGSIGSPLGAAGAIQAGCSALMLDTGWIPPTVNWQFQDPDCFLRLSNRSLFIPHRTALINAHGLCGANSCMVLSRCK